ncbi:Piso0_002730 [Millerozyma farinosa CBS 7064]|uniref:Piso0_002730 protein n=1 Tax=Pichia sorbitophila (strain ATCC MYA-4447 / BCRC 22081 / CBS 7064 / NBRC 10061 / NRRL Y-12695) TaxID=559304 RepID=G8YDC9_PICSO|nr:Piso0_002730 [Millerozyma farinosa CBS 7064]
MSEIKTAKDALVASLFELSRAAQDAAAATLTFYKINNIDGSSSEAQALVSATLDRINGGQADTSDEVNGTGQGDAGKGAKQLKSGPTAAKTEAGQTIINGEVPGASQDGEAGKGKAAAPEKKKRKVVKDPNAPKKPLTIFFAYSFHMRDKIRKEREKQGLPTLSSAELNEIIKAHWNDITPEEKEGWQKKYQNELKEYQVLKEAYKNGLPTPSKAEPLPAPVPPTPEVAPPAPAPASNASEAPKKSKSESKKRKSEKKDDDKTEKSDKSEKGEKSEKSEKEGKESKKAKKSKK